MWMNVHFAQDLRMTADRDVEIRLTVKELGLQHLKHIRKVRLVPPHTVQSNRQKDRER